MAPTLFRTHEQLTTSHRSRMRERTQTHRIQKKTPGHREFPIDAAMTNGLGSTPRGRRVYRSTCRRIAGAAAAATGIATLSLALALAPGASCAFAGANPARTGGGAGGRFSVPATRAAASSPPSPATVASSGRRNRHPDRRPPTPRRPYRSRRRGIPFPSPPRRPCARPTRSWPR